MTARAFSVALLATPVCTISDGVELDDLVAVSGNCAPGGICGKRAHPYLLSVRFDVGHLS